MANKILTWVLMLGMFGFVVWSVRQLIIELPGRQITAIQTKIRLGRVSTLDQVERLVQRAIRADQLNILTRKVKARLNQTNPIRRQRAALRLLLAKAKLAELYNPTGKMPAKVVGDIAYNRFCGIHTDFAIAANTDPGWADARIEYGIFLHDWGGSPTDAVNEFARACRLAPKNPRAHYELARALDTLGNYRGSLLQCDRALALRPKYWPAKGLKDHLLSEHLTPKDPKTTSDRFEI